MGSRSSGQANASDATQYSEDGGERLPEAENRPLGLVATRAIAFGVVWSLFEPSEEKTQDWNPLMGLCNPDAEHGADTLVAVADRIVLHYDPDYNVDDTDRQYLHAQAQALCETIGISRFGDFVDGQFAQALANFGVQVHQTYATSTADQIAFVVMECVLCYGAYVARWPVDPNALSPSELVTMMRRALRYRRTQSVRRLLQNQFAHRLWRCDLRPPP